MRVSPIEMSMANLLGEDLPGQDGIPVIELVRLGHEELVAELGVDLGHDPYEWHKYLSAFSESYHQPPHFIDRIDAAVANKKWRQAVEHLTGRPCDVCRPTQAAD
jgi:hypothetical protein